jgi:hypothetical protein
VDYYKKLEMSDRIKKLRTKNDDKWW